MADILASTSSTARLTDVIGLHGSFTGYFEFAGDTDWIGITMVAGSTYQIWLQVQDTAATGGDAFLTLMDPGGGVVGTNDDGGATGLAAGTLNSFLTYTPTLTGTYFIEAKSLTSQLGSYDIVVSVGGLTFTPLSRNGDIVTNDLNLMGNQGNDTLIGGVSDNVMFGGLGDDSVQGLGGADSIFGEAGDDRLSGGIGNDTLSGGAGFDILSGNEDLDELNGGDGDDFLDGGDGADTLNGDGGDDHLIGGLGDDTLSGGAGDDVIQGNDGLNILLGGDGNDQLDGGGLADTLVGGAGIDTMAGGAGSDRYFVDHIFDTITEGVGGGTDTVLTSVSYILAAGVEIETLRTTDDAGTGGISLYGNEFSQQIVGNAGNNFLSDGGDNVQDLLVGGAGNDSYFIGVSDLIQDVSGIDLVTAFTNVNLSSAVSGFTTIENLTLAGVATTGLGNALKNTITGNAFGNVLTGEGDNDKLFGLLGKDQLVGGIGNDTLSGGAGNDTLTGGMGNDVFLFNEAASAANRDTITDFANAAGNNDIFRLENAFFTKLAATGALNANFFRAGAVALDANDFIVYNKATGALFYDSNGSGAGGAVQIATLTNKAALTAADFFVI